MDITIEYTAEEKELFEEINTLREEVHVLEDEVYLLRKEKQEHTTEYHTQGGAPIVFLVIACLFILVFAADIIVGFGLLDYHIKDIHSLANPSLFGSVSLAIGVAAGTPAVAVVFLVLFAVSYRRYFYQVTKDPEMQKRAAKLNIKNYYAVEERIDRDYERVSNELRIKKAAYEEKKQRLDELLMARRFAEAENERRKAEEESLNPKPKPELKVVRYHSMTESEPEGGKNDESGESNKKEVKTTIETAFPAGSYIPEEVRVASEIKVIDPTAVTKSEKGSGKNSEKQKNHSEKGRKSGSGKRSGNKRGGNKSGGSKSGI